MILIADMVCDCRKKTHTDQYLNFMFHHPLNHKLGVIRTLFHRCDNVVIEEKDCRQEEEHITSVLKQCSYQASNIHKARKDMQDKSEQRIKKASHKKETFEEQRHGHSTIC